MRNTRTSGGDHPPRLQTARLELVPGSLDLCRAELADRPRFAQMLDAEVPAAWPPPENDERTMTYFVEYLEQHPDAVGWGAWYILLRRDDGRRTAVGSCGFLAMPDDAGTCEAGYSILGEYQRRGIAPEALSAILDWAFAHPPVERVIAHTLAGHRPSGRVLEKCGFVAAGCGAEDGTERFERRRQPRADKRQASRA